LGDLFLPIPIPVAVRDLSLSLVALYSVTSLTLACTFVCVDA